MTVAEGSPARSAHAGPPGVRPPRIEDGAAVWSLIRDCGTLELNSPYAYLLMCSDFAQTARVAEVDGELVGAVLGYRPPAHPERIFVWQVGVHPRWRGHGLGLALLEALAAGLEPTGVDHLSATVTPSNEASRALFAGFARVRGAPLEERPRFAAGLFPGGAHEPEVELLIGPLVGRRAPPP